MRKPVKDATSVSTKLVLNDPGFVEAYPAIAEHLCCMAYEDGTKRQTSTVTLFVESGMLKMSLNDREEGRSLYVSSETFLGVVELLEVALMADSPPWRAWPKGKK